MFFFVFFADLWKDLLKILWCWGALGGVLRHLVASWGCLWGLLGALGRSLGALGSSWALLGGSLGALGRSWGALGCSLGAPWGLRGPPWGALGRSLGSLWGVGRGGRNCRRGPKTEKTAIRKKIEKLSALVSANLKIEKNKATRKSRFSQKNAPETMF